MSYVMNFRGKAKRLEATDLPRIGDAIGAGEDELHAFMDVEAGGRGFDEQGRPKILFEPHIFYKELGPGKERDRAVKEGLAYPKWNRNGYNADSYDRLARASDINEDAALRSCSWGLGQIMGFNHQKAGYDTVQAMVQDFMDDEDNHLEAMVRLLVNFKLDDDLRNHNWPKIEQVYNGGGYGGTYAKKMANRFAHWQGKADTPYKRGSDGAEIAVSAGSTPAEIKALQAALKDKNYPIGKVDGKWGKLTRDAVMSFKADNQLNVSDRSLAISEVLRGKPRILPMRQAATIADLREEGSETVSTADKIQTVSVVGGGGLAVGRMASPWLEKFQSLSDTFSSVSYAIEPFKEYFGLLFSPWTLVILLALGAFFYARHAKNKRLEEYKAGKVQ